MATEPSESTAAEPLKVDLDQADWAYMADGKAAAAKDKLAKLGASGQAIFLISHEHLVETAALAEGSRERFRFLRSFPAVLRLPDAGASLIHGHAAASLLAYAGRCTPPQSLPLEARAVALEPEEFWDQWASSHGKRMVRLFDMKARPERFARKARLGKTAKDLEHDARSLGALSLGDQARFEKLLQRGPDAPGPRWVRLTRLATPFIQRFYEVVASHGWLPPPGRKFDDVFGSMLLAGLPRALRRDHKLVKDLQRCWDDSSVRCRIAPSLACTASVIETTKRETERKKYGRADVIDPLHAAYAPHVDIFTCDKRNEAPLRDVLAKASVATKVIRTNRLEKVADEILGST